MPTASKKEDFKRKSKAIAPKIVAQRPESKNKHYIPTFGEPSEEELGVSPGLGQGLGKS